MQHLGTDTVFHGPWWGKEEQIASVHAPLMTGTVVSHNSGIPASEANSVSSVQVGGIGNTPFVLVG